MRQLAHLLSSPSLSLTMAGSRQVAVFATCFKSYARITSRPATRHDDADHDAANSSDQAQPVASSQT
jgi:hypothetical protein